MDQPSSLDIDEINQKIFPTIAPENLDNSKVVSFLNDKLTFKIADLLTLKDINKYVADWSKLLSCLKTCDFLKISDDEQTCSYTFPEDTVVFSMLNFPPKATKKEIEKCIELDNWAFNRLYKRGFYWVLVTNDKETIICAQNALRELKFDDTKVKYDMKNNVQIMKMIKDLIEKNNYNKEAKNWGIEKKGDKKYGDDKGSNNDSENMSWRKRSGEGVASFDKNESSKPFYRNKNNDYTKRTRFNSDNAPSRFQQEQVKDAQEIEIDISNLKYPINIKFKYSFQDMEQTWARLKAQNCFKDKPEFTSLDVVKDIIVDKQPKELTVLKEWIEHFEKKEDKKQFNKKYDKIPEVNTNVKIPKMNPLCSMPKTFNKFDIVPGNMSIPFNPIDINQNK